MKSLLSLVLSVSAGTCAAQADVLYETYDPSNPANMFSGSYLAASNTIVWNQYGVEFSPTTSGDVSSLTAAVTVFEVPPTPPGTPAFYQFLLFAAPVSGPPNLLGPGSSSPIDSFIESVSNNSIANITFLSTMHPFLTAGDDYWLYQGPPPGGAQWLTWGILSGEAISGTLDNDSVNPVFDMETHDVTTAVFPAFQINSSVPEPAFGRLTGSILVVLTGAWAVRQRRRKSRD